MAEAELLQNWKSPGCELIPRDTLRRMESPPGVEPVRYLSGGIPRYPVDLKRRGITGRVSLRFIVDCSGRVVPSSLIVIGYTDTAFVKPAMLAMESAQFSPAKARAHIK